MAQLGNRGGMQMKKVVITGGCGLLGDYVVDEFLRHYEVSVLDVKEPTLARRREQCTYQCCSVLDRQGVIECLADHDAVVHLAGIDAAVPAEPAAYFETNVMGTWNVLHAAELAGHSKAVICSSVSAIGFADDGKVVGPDQLPANEQQRPQPTHPYGLSKQVMEVVGRSFAERGALRIVALRPALVIYPHIIEEVARHVALADGERKVDVSSGEVSADSLSPTRSYVRPEDAARCFRLALEADTGSYDEFYVLASDTYSPEDTLAGVERRFGALPGTLDRTRFEDNPRAAALSNLKARQILNWQPTGDWPTLLADSLKQRDR